MSLFLNSDSSIVNSLSFSIFFAFEECARLILLLTQLLALTCCNIKKLYTTVKEEKNAACASLLVLWIIIGFMFDFIIKLEIVEEKD